MISKKAALLSLLILTSFTSPALAYYCEKVSIILEEDSLSLDLKECHLSHAYTLFIQADVDKNGYINYSEVERYQNLFIAKNIRPVGLDIYLDGKPLHLKVKSMQFLNLFGKYDPNDATLTPVVNSKLVGVFEPLKAGAHSVKINGKYLNAGELTFASEIQNSEIIDVSHGQLSPKKVVVNNFRGGTFLVSFEVKQVKQSTPFPSSTATVLGILIALLIQRKSRR